MNAGQFSNKADDGQGGLPVFIYIHFNPIRLGVAAKDSIRKGRPGTSL